MFSATLWKSMNSSKLFTRLALVFVVLIAAPGAHAENTPRWELSGGSQFTFAGTAYGSQGGRTNSTRSLTIQSGANYFILPELEAGLSFNLALFNGGGNTTSYIAATAGPTYNFIGKPIQSFFVTVQAGLIVNSNGPYESNYNQFTALLGLGKRFELISHVAYKPEITVQYISDQSYTYSPLNTEDHTRSQVIWSLIPFQFSVLF